MFSPQPKLLGEFELDASEMMCIQYLPVKMPYSVFRLPDNLRWMHELLYHTHYTRHDYVYVTAKHMYQNGKPYNRQGWHIDGFGTDDSNYIWSDSCPTEFCVQEFTLSEHHNLSMQQMQEQARLANIVTFPNNSLVRLTQENVHRVGPVVDGMRTFIKISVSKEKYNLKGNAHNYLFDYNWDMQERKIERNDPHGK